MILGIFIAAVICVIIVVILIYQNGLRYVKSDVGIKYFGDIDKNDNIISGRMWFESDAASISLQKFYIIEVKDPLIESFLPDRMTFLNDPGDYENGSIDVLGVVNNSLPKEITDHYPLNNFVFNQSDDGIFLRNETFEVLIKDYENEDIILKSGEIYTYDSWPNSTRWILTSSADSVSSYKNFEVVKAENEAKKYKEDIIDFIKKEDIVFASFALTDGTLIYLYPARNIYRISYDKGNRVGEVYIGEINNNFQKNGKGLYYYKNDDLYYGDFLKEEKTGKCELYTAQGNSYSGYMDNGRKIGEGIFVWSDGSSYSGTFENNMKNGWGINVYSDGSVYEGDFVDDVKHGIGKYTWPSGDCYEGNFDHSVPHGWGIFYWISGRRYEGWFSDGKLVLDKPDDIEGEDGVSEPEDFLDILDIEGL